MVRVFDRPNCHEVKNIGCDNPLLICSWAFRARIVVFDAVLCFVKLGILLRQCALAPFP